MRYYLHIIQYTYVKILTSFAIRQSFLQEKRAVAEEFTAIGTVEAFRMEVLSNCI